MRNFKYLLSIVLAIGFFTGCVEGLIKTGLEIEGRVAKGAISGAIVTAYDKDGNTLGNTTTDTNGYYTISADLFYADIVTVSSTGGTYFDESTSASNIPVTNFILTAISTIDKEHGNTINLTPFTTIAHDKLKASGNDTSMATIDQVNKQIAKIYTGSSFDVTKTIPNIVNDTSDDGLVANDEKRYGLLLSAFSQTTAGNSNNVQTQIDKFVAGTLLDEDGISNSIATELETAINDASVINDSSADEVSTMYQAIQSSKTAKIPTYSGNVTLNKKYNEQIDWHPPYSGATVTGCLISPAIGFGLSFDPVTCDITGKPNEVNATDYNITAYNDEGNGSFVLTIDIDKADRIGFSIGSGYNKVDGDPDFNITATLLGNILTPADGVEYNTSHPAIVGIGSLTGTATINSSGISTITATYPANDFYAEAIATCDVVVADQAPEINGSVKVINAVYGTPPPNWTPQHSGGAPTDVYTISPPATNLPGGFSFDAPSGVISASAGPTATGTTGLPFNQFTVTAHNFQGLGSTTVDFNISKATLASFTMGGDRAMTKDAADYPSDAVGGTVDGNIEYFSSNTTVANINIATGFVTIKNVVGHTTISARYINDPNYFDANTSYLLTISDSAPNITGSHDVNVTYDTDILPAWQIGNTGGGITACVLTQDIKTAFNLDFNATNCEISGVPNATTLGTVLNFTASNSAPGNSMAAINLVINKADQIAFSAGAPLNVELSDDTQSQIATGNLSSQNTGYTSGNTSIALVHSVTGVIQPVSVGVTYIKAYSPADLLYNEADANYTLTIVDNTAPVLDYDNSTPAHNSSAVSTVDDIVIKFDEDISYIIGKTITITEVGTSGYNKVFSTAGNITTSGDEATLHMNGDSLPALSQFFITIENGAFEDVHNNPSIDTGGLGTWDFNTTTDVVPPSILYDTSTPANLAANISVVDDIIIKFDENISYNSPMTVTITDLNSTYKKTFTDTNISTLDDEATLDMGTDRLPYGHEFFITVDVSAFDDINNNGNIDTGGNGVWNFSTLQGPCDAPCVDNCNLSDGAAGLAPGGGGGGMSLTSTSYTAGGVMPGRLSCSGTNVSPQYSWANAPAGTLGYVLIMDDETAPCGAGTNACKHWALYNIADTTTSLVEDFTIPAIPGINLTEGRNYNWTNDYEGPCPPSGTTHTYNTTIYAMGVATNIASGTAHTRASFANDFAADILDQATYSGTYTSP